MTYKKSKKVNNFKLISLIFAAAVIFLGFLPLQPIYAAADPACAGLETQINILDDKGTLDAKNKVDPLKGLPKVCTVNGLSYRVIQIFFYAAGGIAVVFIMIGGFQYMMGMSTGGDEAIGKAKKTITYALVGLVIIILAGTIVTMLYNLVTGGTSGGSSSTTIGGGGPFDPSNPGDTNPTGGNPTDPPGGGNTPPTIAPITYSVMDKGANHSGGAYSEIYSVTVTGTQAAIKQLCNNQNTGNVDVAVENVVTDEKSFSGGSVVFNSIEANSPSDISVTVCDQEINQLTR